jgi:hypothetical protein
LERRRVFAGNDLGLCVNAGFQGIEADDCLAFSGAWASRFLRVGGIQPTPGLMALDTRLTIHR